MQRLALLLVLGLVPAIAADEIPLAKPKPEPRFKFSAWIDGGVTFNPASPRDHQNFGRLFDDRANEPMLNQLVVNLERALVPQPGEIDWGFKLQFMYGSDARFIHSLGLFDTTAHEILQPDLVEAYLSLHLPVATAGGIDVKLGKFVTLEGAETIDARTNFFYSHTYLFNFSIPFNHTGALLTWHASSEVDVMAGITGGVNTSFGSVRASLLGMNASLEDNNSAFGFHGGLGIKLQEGRIAILASTHIGAETPGDNHHLRYLNTVTTTWKISEKLTSITDLVFTLDDASDAKAYGVAQYLTYSVNDWLSAGLRAEIFRDGQGFYVVSFADNDDPMDLLRGTGRNLDPRTVGGGKTTYGAVTIGLNIKPPVSKPHAGLTIRPEVRYDRALTDTRPFNDSSDRDLFTFGLDIILSY